MDQKPAPPLHKTRTRVDHGDTHAVVDAGARVQVALQTGVGDGVVGGGVVLRLLVPVLLRGRLLRSGGRRECTKCNITQEISQGGLKGRQKYF